ncbi:hypothetical protein SAMN05444372_11730 [Flavobacterium micromati]|uniref:Oxidoreductase n=1 Tax=Flavobacterium micromati TaxID=229205 RepID=A0A1M5QJ84_9FLAO|nr:oxidoreductase [Flavobacterium micromati]SHH13860.1 hypothetical protein SAMN05444372_11730 [Flavobacterium micromati]
MKNSLLFLFISLILYSCKTNNYINHELNNVGFKSVVIDTLFKDKISIRAILIDGNKIWYAADKAKFGFYDLNLKSKVEKSIENDTVNLEFRSIAQTRNNIFIINVGNPALLYKISKNKLSKQVVYQEKDEKVFFDSMQFWDDNDGIAMGDPVSNCLNIILTKDGGNSWSKVSCEKLPKVAVGEAAFAASNTNIILKNNNAWIVSGGVKSRVFYSPDRGSNWSVYETPIVQGKAMTGIFTADFYDFKNGFIAGGDYELPNQNVANKAITTNGGKKWKLIANEQAFGYASCIQYVPESNGRALVTVGTAGLFYSNSAGKKWTKLLNDSSLYTLRFFDKNNAVAAGKDKMIHIKFRN